MCRPTTLFLVVLTGLIISLLLALASAQSINRFWQHFGLILIFVQWVGLGSAGLLCLYSRLNLNARSEVLVGFAAPPVLAFFYGLVLITWFPFSVEEPGWLLLRYILIAMLLSLIFSRLLVLQQRWRSQTEAEARARLDALQARIRPHFLFNALNAIAELIHEQPDAAEEALLDLSDLLRIGLGTEVRHSLSEELALIRGYLRIEALRLGDKLRVEWLLPERLPDELQLPPLVLQPLVENAVIHGVAARADGGELLIRAQRISFRRLRFEIENPMPGARESADRPGHGTALENIRQRLALAYEERASLKTWEHDGKFHAALTVPLDQ